MQIVTSSRNSSHSKFQITNTAVMDLKLPLNKQIDQQLHLHEKYKEIDELPYISKNLLYHNPILSIFNPNPIFQILLTYGVLGFWGSWEHVFLGKVRAEPLRWPDRDSGVLAFH